MGTPHCAGVPTKRFVLTDARSAIKDAFKTVMAMLTLTSVRIKRVSAYPELTLHYHDVLSLTPNGDSTRVHVTLALSPNPSASLGEGL